ncbi:MAG: hypothetical protein H3C43_08765 [Leptonema sp. (in: Bacteria)]|nr:hypothetical protein [Leptonema sp. (in: bacteria)]
MNTDVAVRFLLFGAFLGFIVFWNFDLGFFYDFDLIFGLSLSAGVLAELLIHNPPNQTVILISVAIIQTGLWMIAFSRFF